MPHVTEPLHTSRPRRLDPAPSHGPLLLGLVGLSAVAIYFSRSHGLGSAVSLLMAGSSMSVVIAWSLAASRKDPFSTIGLIYIYSALTVIASIAVAATVGFQGTFLGKQLLTPRLMLVQGLFLAGLFVAALRSYDGRREVPAEKGDQSPRVLSLGAGYLFLLAAAAYRAYQLRTQGIGSWNSSRGTDFSAASQLEVIVGILPLAAVALFLLADHRRRSTVIPAPAVAILVLWATVSLAIGTRDEVIGPVIVLAWAYHHRVRRLRMSVVGALAALGFVLFALVGVWRVGSNQTNIADLVRSVSSGTNTTALTVANVPANAPYLHGDTYVASLRYGLPFFGPSHATGSELSATLRFPELIGYTANSGLGFSPIAEAYWNFGLIGAFCIPLGFGFAAGWFSQRQNGWASRPIHLIYPILIARTPIAMRSDFLQQYKGVLMAILVVWIVYIAEKVIISNRTDRRKAVTRRKIVPG